MAIELQRVVKVDGVETHIRETSIAFEAGGFNILLGTTLAGKTTLMRLMAGLEKPTSGRVLFRGVDVTGVAVQKRNVSMVYQQFINYGNLSVYDNIASPLRVAGQSRAEVDSRVRRAAELLKLTPMLERRPAALSGGQQQRTAIARALVKDADLVLLDEPLANLDYKLREELREELPAILAEKGATVIYATSEPQEALQLAGHTATLHEGRITQFGETAAVYHNPCDLVTAQVFADPPLNTARVVKRGARFLLGDAVAWTAHGASAALVDGEYEAALRPHHITPEPVSDTPVVVPARVMLTELSGSESIVHIDVAGRSWVSQSHGIHPLNVGENTSMYLQAERFLYFDHHGARMAG